MIYPAHVVFSRNEGNLISGGIRAFDGSPWSHVELIADESDYPNDTRITVISAEMGGVFAMGKDLKNYDAYAILYHPGITLEVGKSIVREASKLIGIGNYDYQGLFTKIIELKVEDPEKYVCSEVVHLAFWRQGWPLVRRIEEGELVTPRHLWNSAVLVGVE